MSQSKKSRIFLIVLLAMSLTAPAIPQVQADSGEWQIEASFDDGCKYAATSMYFTGATIYWVHSAQAMEIGVRWLNVNIPQGSVIESAYWGWYSWGAQAQPVDPNFTIKGDDEDNCATFSTGADFNNRPRTDASVVYEMPVTTGSYWYNTSDLKTIIQEIVDRPGWESGNALALLTDSHVTGTVHQFRGWDSYPNEASKLYVTWSALPAPPDPTSLFGAGFNASSPYVELHWNHSLVDVQFFEVQNSSDADSWTYLGQSTTANYTDSQVVNGTERYYRVRACNQTDAVWYNSSWTDVNFDKVYFIPGGAPPGDGAPPVEDYSVIFLAIGLIFCLAIAFLYVKNK